MSSRFVKLATASYSSAFRLTRPIATKPAFLQHSLRIPATSRIFSMMDENGNGPKDESTHGKNEWKEHPPYTIHSSNEEFKSLYDASCHCGKVKYQLSREAPLDSKICHCTTCQTQHGMLFPLNLLVVVLFSNLCPGAPFQWAAIFHKEDINFSHGHHDLEWYDPSTKKVQHKLPCKVRCSHCHSPIMDEGRNMILLFPTLIHFEGKEEMEKFKPKYVLINFISATLHLLIQDRCHMFYSERVIDIPDGLPKWTGLNGSSDLIEDSPADMVKELKQKRKHEDENEDDEKSKKTKGRM